MSGAWVRVRITVSVASRRVKHCSGPQEQMPGVKPVRVIWPYDAEEPDSARSNLSRSRAGRRAHERIPTGTAEPHAQASFGTMAPWLVSSRRMSARGTCSGVVPVRAASAAVTPAA